MNEEVADYGEDDSEMYAGTDVDGGDDEIEEMKRRVQEMESEHEKLSEMQQNVDKQLSTAEQAIDENSM
jgi:predicted transcriptional regulator